MTPFEEAFQEFFRSKTLDGRATPQGTTRFFADTRISESSYANSSWFSLLSNSDITASRLGFGSYRVGRGIPTHFEALREAILLGTNVIDTSTNYTDGASEALVGDVISELIEAGRIERNQIIVVTKIGYIQGKNLHALLKDRDSYSEVVEYSEDCYHSIHPDFIEEQVELSLRRLGLRTIDVLLLHNPEYFLLDAKKRRVKAETAQTEYYSRIKRAFDAMEGLVRQGKIQYYGISSNTFPSTESEYEATSLKRILEIAGKSFKVIQFPANLLEKSFRRPQLARLATDAGLWTLANRPLNAFSKGGLLRLAGQTGLVGSIENPREEIDEILKELKELETRIIELFAAHHFTFSERTPPVSGIIETYMNHFDTAEQFHYGVQSLGKALHGTFHYLGRFAEGNESMYALDSYQRTTNAAFAKWEKTIKNNYHNSVESLRMELERIDPALTGLPLSLQAISYLLGDVVPHTVLVGMRNREYVRQVSSVYGKSTPRLTSLPVMEGTVSRFAADRGNR